MRQEERLQEQYILRGLENVINRSTDGDTMSVFGSKPRYTSDFLSLGP